VEAHHVVRFMAARGTRSVVVVDGVRPIGIVTSRDLSDRVSGGGLSATLARVESAMSSPLITIGEWGAVVDAIAMMNQRGVSHLPIVSANGHLVSLITLGDAQHLRSRGVSGLNEFVRTSVIVSMARRRAWKRMVHEVRKRIRENRLWFFLAVGLALAGAVLALAMSRSWLGFQTYQPKDYEPKDLPRQQYEEQKNRSKQTDLHPRAR
ncbi:MAG: CBS domain-containing protein, partial [Nitrospirae bacterium]|nr:CBS domain-containing protein [Nitrospirota bacterium]